MARRTSSALQAGDLRKVLIRYYAEYNRRSKQKQYSFPRGTGSVKVREIKVGRIALRVRNGLFVRPKRKRYEYHATPADAYVLERIKQDHGTSAWRRALQILGVDIIRRQSRKQARRR